MSLPPLLVDRRSMRVIDGMHRLMAALLKKRETIDVEFFDGSYADAFLLAVEANVAHGLPCRRLTGRLPPRGLSRRIRRCRTGRSPSPRAWRRAQWRRSVGVQLMRCRS
jgi:hypothetical protein